MFTFLFPTASLPNHSFSTCCCALCCALWLLVSLIQCTTFETSTYLHSSGSQFSLLLSFSFLSAENRSSAVILRHVVICPAISTALNCHNKAEDCMFNGPSRTFVPLSTPVGTHQSSPICFYPLAKPHLEYLYTRSIHAAALLPPGRSSQALRYPHPACHQSFLVMERNHQSSTAEGFSGC